MKGWLVTNGFLKSDKFNGLYEFFQNSARELNIHLQQVSSDSLLCEATDGFSNFARPDFVLFWDKDVLLAKRLENAGFRLFNSARAVEICDNKALTALHLANVVPMPKTVYSPKTFEGVGYTNLDFVHRAVEIVGLPVVVKEVYGSFGRQVYLAKTVDELESIVSRLVGKDFLLQQFVAESAGKDIRVNVVGTQAVNAIYRSSVNGDFRSNVTLGGRAEPHVLTPWQKALAEKACEAVGLDFAGVDILLGNDGPVLCEINSNMHFKSTFDVTGVDLSKNILQWIVKQLGN